MNLECRPQDVAILNERAVDLRDEASRWKNPFYPHIPCAGPNCAMQAVEGYYFCSEVCKAAYEASR